MNTKLKHHRVPTILVKAYLKILMKPKLCHCIFKHYSSINLVTLDIGNVHHLAKGSAGTNAQLNHIFKL
jgi:hypothetical protein